MPGEIFEPDSRVPELHCALHGDLLAEHPHVAFGEQDRDRIVHSNDPNSLGTVLIF